MSEITVTSNTANCKEFNFLKGYTDEEGVLHTTFAVRGMTGRDEELISSKREKNQAKILTDLLSRCITRIGTLTPSSVGGMAKWSDVIRSLYVGDCDYAMIKVRAESLGEEIIFTNNCPSCGEELKTSMQLDELEVIEFKGYDTIHCELPRGFTDGNNVTHTEGTLRLVTQRDREALDSFIRTNPAKAKTLLLSRCFTFNDGFPVSANIISELTTKDRNYLMDLIEENAFGVKSEVEIECSECGELFKAKFDSANFM